MARKRDQHLKGALAGVSAVVATQAKQRLDDGRISQTKTWSVTAKVSGLRYRMRFASGTMFEVTISGI